MLACVRLLLLFKSKQRLRFGKRGRGTENIANLQIATLKSKRLLPSRFEVGKLTFRTRLFTAASESPSLQRPAHRGCRGTSLPRSFPGSLAPEKPGRQRPRRNGPHRLPRRRKSHGQRIRGCRKSRECLLAFDCSSSLNRSRGFGLENGGGGRKIWPIYR